MANGLFKPMMPDDLNSFDPAVDFSADTITFTYGSADDGSETRFSGSFTYSVIDFTDSLTAGIITAISDQTWWHDYSETPEVYYNYGISISGFSLSATSYKAMTAAQFAAAVLAGDDNISGGERGDYLTGLGGNDTLFGVAGNDTLLGGSGADSMLGGTGDDIYNVDNPDDVVVEGLAGGADTINTTVFFDLADTPQVENLRVLGGDDLSLRGNALNNILAGNQGNNIFLGMGGRDTASFAFASGAVNASLSAGKATGAGQDFFVSIESLVGSGFADRLSGDGLGNMLKGGAGADTLTGGGARDILIGQAGSDVFDFNALSDSGGLASTRDLITDLASGDRIDLRTIDAISGGADTAFSLVATRGTATSAVAAGKIGWYQVNLAGTADDRTILRMNVDSDATIEMSVEIMGLHTITSGLFLL